MSNRTTVAPLFEAATATLSIKLTFLPRGWWWPNWAGRMRSATAGFLMPAGGQLASERDINAATAAEGDVARRLGIVVGREDGGKLPCKGSAPVFHSHRKCWDIASRRKTALLAGSGASAALAIGERFDLPGFIMDFTSLMPNKSPEPTAVGACSSAVAVHVASRRWLSFLR